MIKKILTITAAALVTTTMAWGQNNFGYSVSSIETTGNKPDSSIVFSYTRTAQGSGFKADVTKTSKVSASNYSVTYIITPTSVVDNSVNLTGWNNKLITGTVSQPQVTYTYTSNRTQYQGVLATLPANYNIVLGNTFRNNGKGTFLNSNGTQSVSNTGINIYPSKYYEKYEEPIYDEVYDEELDDFIVDFDNIIGSKDYYYAIDQVNYTESETNTYNNCYEYYVVRNIPANFLTDEVISLIIPTTVTTIDTQAFANVSKNLAGITANGSFKVVGDALYNVAGTRLIYVMQSAVNNGIFTVPAAVTSIDPYAFKNVENSTIFLNNKVTSYTGTSGNGNTFIGNTLNSGSITDNMLTSGAYEVPNNITTIKEGAFCSTLTSVTIPSTVTKIEAGAFKNCTNLQVITLRSGSTYKLIDNMLINQNHNIIVVTKNVPKNISFQDYVSQVGAYISKVYDYAFKNVTGVTVSSNKDFNVDETKQGTGNTFIMPDVDLHREANVITGNVTRENFAKLAFNAGWCYDLRDANILEPLDADFFAEHVPHNCLLFFGEVNNNGNMVAGDNIVWAEKTTGGKTVYRSNHVIMYDDAPYHNDIAEVECVQADMYRTYKSRQWATIYVPIDFTGITSNTWVGDFDKYDPTTKSLHFKVVENVTHNRPYVLFNNLGIDVPMLGKPNVTLYMSTEDAQPVTWNNMIFTGDYDEWKVTTQTNIYGYTSSGKFAHATTGATFKPFRAWFVDNNTYSNGNELHAIFEDEEGNEINLGSASGIEEIDEPEFEGGIYNLNGTKVNDMKNPGLYIQNGKIIIIK